MLLDLRALALELAALDFGDRSFEGCLDDYYFPSKDGYILRWSRRDIFPRREGNVRYERAGVEYEMRATDLFKGQTRHPVCRITL